MVTLKEIAQKAGVSKSTVSRYLNDGHVSEKTKAKLKKIIEETNYQPNTFARSLKATTTKMIGVIIPRFDSASTALVLKGIDELAYERDMQLLIVNSALSHEREEENINILARQKVAGIILLATHTSKKLMDHIKKLKIPVLLVGQKDEDLSYLIHDDYASGRKMAEHAIQLGHKKVLYIGVSEEDQAVGIERKKGFLDRIAEENLHYRVIETSFSRRDNYKKAKKYLQNIEETYIACATDNMAIAVIKAAKDLGYELPKDLSISGFGGYTDIEYTTPTLTTIRYPYKESGQQSLKIIQDLIAKKEERLHIVLPNELVPNESTQTFIMNDE